MTSLDSFRALRTLEVSAKTYAHYSYYSLPRPKERIEGQFAPALQSEVLLENLLRHEDGPSVTKDDILAVSQWLETKTSERDVAFRAWRALSPVLDAAHTIHVVSSRAFPIARA